jgi:hypothetical protein
MRHGPASLPLILLWVGSCAYITPGELERRTDLDQDGAVNVQFGGSDCDDGDPRVYPGAPDTPYDGIDSDCDGWSDHDVDRDGADLGEDCDDEDPELGPAVEDIPYDGIDSDCDGWSDYDADQDGFDVDEDCNDSDATVFPGAEDAPYDEVDADCGGDQYEFDADRDGYEKMPRGPDCDDTSAEVHPAAAEEWYNGIDENCDENDCDKDGDGHDYEGQPCDGYDCNDNDPTFYPGSPNILKDCDLL